MDYKARITQMTITPEGEPIFSEQATQISIDDEAAGEFIVIKQPMRTDGGIAINPDEWPIISKTVERMLTEMEKHEKSISPKL